MGSSVAISAFKHFLPGAIGPRRNVQKFARQLSPAHEHEEAFQGSLHGLKQTLPVPMLSVR